MTEAEISYDDLPWADERVIREHAAELIELAESLGMTNLRYASGNRIVLTLTDHVVLLGEFRFAEEASLQIGYQIRAYTDGVLKNPGVSRDLVDATPL
jgi:hypothetical protein